MIRMIAKIMPLTNPNFKITNTPEELCELVKHTPIITNNSKYLSPLNLQDCTIIGMVESKTRIEDDMIIGDVLLSDEKYLEYEFDNYICDISRNDTDRDSAPITRVRVISFEMKKEDEQ